MTEKEFIIKWTTEVSSVLLKSFPDQFIVGYEASEQKMPEISLVLGTELFGSYEITDIEGNSKITCDSLIKAKFILYANLNKPNSIQVPLKEAELEAAVKDYEKHLDLIIHTLENAYKSKIVDGKNFFQVSNAIFNSLNLKRY